MTLRYTFRNNIGGSIISAIAFVCFSFITTTSIWAQTGAVTFTANGTALDTSSQWKTFKPDFPNDINRVETRIFKMPVKGQGIAGVKFKLVGADGGTARASSSVTNNAANGGQGSTVTFTLAALDSTTWGKPFIVTFGKMGESKSINNTFCTSGGGGATGMAWLGSSRWYTKSGYYAKYTGPWGNVSTQPNGLLLAGAAGGGGAWADPTLGTGVKNGNGGDMIYAGTDNGGIYTTITDCSPQSTLVTYAGASFLDTAGAHCTSASSFIRTQHSTYDSIARNEFYFDMTFGQGGGLAFYTFDGQAYNTWQSDALFELGNCQVFSIIAQGGNGGAGYVGGGAGGGSFGDDYDGAPGGGGGGTIDGTKNGDVGVNMGGYGGKSYCSPILFTNISITPGSTTANPSSGSFAYLTIKDTVPPVARCKDVTITLTNGNSNFYSYSVPTILTRAMVDNGSTDNDAIQSFSFSKDSFSCGDIGVNNVVVTVRDVAGNIDTAHIRVTVVDAAPPVLVISNQSYTIDIKNGPHTLVRNDFPPALDYCTGTNYTFTFAPTTFDCSEAGTTQAVAYTMTDTYGNSVTQTQNFNIINSQASIIYVDSSATGNNNGSSWADAYVNLQDALHTAGCVPTRQIYVAKGTYYPDRGTGITINDRSATFTLHNNDKIYGGFPSGGGFFNDRDAAANTTVLSGYIGTSSFQDNSYHIVTVPAGANGILIEGFTVTGGYGTESVNSAGAAITFKSSSIDNDYKATLSKCIFKNNVAAKGGAIGLDSINNHGGAILQNCIFQNNSAFYNGGVVYINGSTFTQAALLATNCMFTGNSATSGGVIYYTNAISNITNCTISNNTATQAGGAIQPVNSSISINNTILWNDRVNGTVSEIGASNQCTFYYSDVAGSGGSNAWNTSVGNDGGNNIDADPLFISASVFQLNTFSPCVNAGNNAYISMSTDLNNHARIVQNTVDMGAYETNNTVFVAWDAPAGGDGQSWATALNKVSDGIDSALTGLNVKDVWIKTGNYYPDRDLNNVANGRYNTFNLRGTVHLYGGFAGNESYLDQRNIAAYPTTLNGDLGTSLNDTDNAYHVVTLTGNYVGLDGLVVQMGNANHNSDAAYRCGGGVCYYGNPLSANPVIRNCVFRYNEAVSGGAIGISGGYGDYTLDVVQSLFYQNQSTFNGGAIYVQNRSSGGSGVKCNLYSCTGAKNLTTWTQGGFVATESITQTGALTSIYNSVLWNNTINNGSANDYSNISGGATLTYNSVIGTDPLFADITNPQGPDGILFTGDDGLRPLAPSPAINAGNNNFLYAGQQTDILGAPRILQSVTDAGVYETYGCLGLTKLYVDASVDTSGNGSSWANAFKYLSDALSLAGTCPGVDTVFVAKGTYYPTGDNGSISTRDVSFRVINPVVILGGYPAGGGIRDTDAGETILSGDINTSSFNDNAYHILTVKNNLANPIIIDGFTFTNGNANGSGSGNYGFLNDRGGAIQCLNTNLVVSHCIFTNNKAASTGGTVWINSSNFASYRCVYQNSKGTYGGVMRFDSNSGQTEINLKDNFFINDTALTGGGVISINVAAAYPDTISNNVFINNYSSGYAATIDALGGNNYIVNNTFYGNNATAGSAVVNVWSPGAGTLLQNNIFYKNKGGVDTLINVSSSGITPVLVTNSSNVDPQFENEQNLAGDDGIWGTTDDGLMIKGTSPLVNSGTNTFDAFSSTDITGHQRVQFGTIDPGAYESGSRIKHWYVNYLQDTAVADGISWATAFPTFQQALSASRNGDTIWIAAGRYMPAVTGTTFAMKAGVKIYGGFKGDEQLYEQRSLSAGFNTILAGNGARVFVNQNVDTTALLDGLIIQGGNTDSTGGGMYNNASSPVISNVVFTGNHAGNGGAMANINGSNPVIVNAIFSGNSATNEGGAIYNNASTPTFINVTIAADSALTGAAIANDNASALTVNNSIVWGNSVDDISLNNSQANVSYTLTQTNISGTGNINHVDPDFISPQSPVGADGLWFTADDGLRLYNTSVGFNSGNNTFVTGITTDIAGSPRIRSGYVNMGAYEDSSQTQCDLFALNNIHILYVDATVPASGDGSSWQTAFRTLNEALNIANYCNTIDSIRVAAGTYYPTGYSDGTDRTASFTILRSNLNIVGGYANRTGQYNRGLYNTYLSGNIGNAADSTDNSFHVVTVTAAVNSSSINGFIITGGYAKGNGGAHSTDGAAVLCNAETFTIVNCVISHNTCLYGTILNTTEVGATLEMDNCVITGNNAVSGGGVYNQSFYGSAADLNIYHCTFAGNTTTNSGSAIYSDSYYGSVLITNSIIWANTYNGSVQQLYSTGSGYYFLVTYSLLQGGLSAQMMDLGGNQVTNPLFANINTPMGSDGKWMTQEDGLALHIGSPAIQAGITGTQILDDITGRLRTSPPDMGAYQNPCTGIVFIGITTAACDSSLSPTGRYYWKTSGTYRDTLLSAIGCDTVYIVFLTVNHTTRSAMTASTCNQYTSAGGHVWDSTGVYYDTLTSITGCDSIVTINLTIFNTQMSSLNATICANHVYAFNGTLLNASGNYNDTLTTIHGCDSIVTLNLTVLPALSATINASICTGQSYMFNSTAITASGIYRDTLQSIHSCDSIITLHLTVSNMLTSSFSQAICTGDSYLFNSRQLTQAGNYTDTVQSTGGCDSIVTLNLTVLPALSTTINASICIGQSYAFNSIALTASGTYKDTLQSINGCDSVVTLHLTVTNVLTSSFSQVICAGDSFLFIGRQLTQAGNYTDTVQSTGGCDSVITLQLAVLPVLSTTANASICQGSSFNFNGTPLSSSGVYTDTVTSSAGCDSIIALTLTVNPQQASSFTESICAGDNYIFNGSALTATGIYIDTLTAVSGCDSIVTFNLQVNQVNNQVSVNGAVCTALQDSAAYQWIDCAKNVPVNGANSQIYTATLNGSYACIISKGNCVDTSNCVTVTGLGLTEPMAYQLNVYPNPTSGIFTIEHNYKGQLNMQVIDNLGRSVKVFTITKATEQFDITGLAAGVYHVFILNGTEHVGLIKLIKQ